MDEKIKDVMHVIIKLLELKSVEEEHIFVAIASNFCFHFITKHFFISL